LSRRRRLHARPLRARPLPLPRRALHPP